MNHSTKEPLILKTKTLFLYKQNTGGRAHDKSGDTTVTTTSITTTGAVLGMVNMGRHAERPRNQFL